MVWADAAIAAYRFSSASSKKLPSAAAVSCGSSRLGEREPQVRLQVVLGQVGQPTVAEQLVEGTLGPPRGRRVGPAQSQQRLGHEWIARHPLTVSTTTDVPRPVTRPRGASRAASAPTTGVRRGTTQRPAR